MENLTKEEPEGVTPLFPFVPIENDEIEAIKSQGIMDLDYILFSGPANHLFSSSFDFVFTNNACKFFNPKIVDIYSSTYPLAISFADVGIYHVCVNVSDRVSSESSLKTFESSIAHLGWSHEQMEYRAMQSKLLNHFNDSHLIVFAFGQKSSIAILEANLDLYLSCFTFELAIGIELSLEGYALGIMREERPGFKFYSLFSSRNACNLQSKTSVSASTLIPSSYRINFYNTIFHLQKKHIPCFNCEFGGQEAAFYQGPSIVWQALKSILKTIQSVSTTEILSQTKFRFETYHRISSRNDFESMKRDLMNAVNNFVILKIPVSTLDFQLKNLFNIGAQLIISKRATNDFHSLLGFSVFLGMLYKGIYAKQLATTDFDEKNYSMMLNHRFFAEEGLSLFFFEKTPLPVFKEYIYVFKSNSALTNEIYIYFCSILMMLSQAYPLGSVNSTNSNCYLKIMSHWLKALCPPPKYTGNAVVKTEHPSMFVEFFLKKTISKCPKKVFRHPIMLMFHRLRSRNICFLNSSNETILKGDFKILINSETLLTFTVILKDIQTLSCEEILLFLQEENAEDLWGALNGNQDSTQVTIYQKIKKFLKSSVESICVLLTRTTKDFRCPFSFDSVDDRIILSVLFGKIPYPRERILLLEALKSTEILARVVFFAILYYQCSDLQKPLENPLHKFADNFRNKLPKEPCPRLTHFKLLAFTRLFEVNGEFSHVQYNPQKRVSLIAKVPLNCLFKRLQIPEVQITGPSNADLAALDGEDFFEYGNSSSEEDEGTNEARNLFFINTLPQLPPKRIPFVLQKTVAAPFPIHPSSLGANPLPNPLEDDASKLQAFHHSHLDFENNGNFSSNDLMSDTDLPAGIFGGEDHSPFLPSRPDEQAPMAFQTAGRVHHQAFPAREGAAPIAQAAAPTAQAAAPIAQAAAPIAQIGVSQPQLTAPSFRERLMTIFREPRQEHWVNIFVRARLTPAVIQEQSLADLTEYVSGLCGTNPFLSEGFAQLLKDEFQ